ncbi:uncharacterized protein LOC120768147 [Bactrocera tryoni]|uniref:uncharacterized protein LOC120768147 n=1 Tax=Bactrocera tryoni TaxID=59916 RepID=UPI001A959051|nr:uncharacterized protein LOC120768147 [Bactrocera tryoni]
MDIFSSDENSNAPCTLDAIETLPIFKSWELNDDICSILVDYGVTSTIILTKMDWEDIDCLFEKLPTKFFGECIKFKAGLREWRKNMNIPLVRNASTLSASSRILEWLEKMSDDLNAAKSSRDSSPVLQPTYDNCMDSRSLTDLLKGTVEGQLVLHFQQKNCFLDAKQQNTMCHCVIENYIGRRKKLTYGEMQKWANIICDVFPKENPETYFLARKYGKKNPTRKLFSRWTNADKTNYKKFSTDRTTTASPAALSSGINK